ncbi:MAG: hypothetical protein M5U34_23275 [Chloroflexi bacterium]|nr:hypothetical protein [Chloroflexota bacterium]
MMYLGVISTVIYFSFISQCSGPAAWYNALLLPTLLGLELWEYRRGRELTSRRSAWLLLILRMALIQAVVMVDCSGFRRILVSIDPLYRLFFFGSAGE